MSVFSGILSVSIVSVLVDAVAMSSEASSGIYGFASCGFGGKDEVS